MELSVYRRWRFILAERKLGAHWIGGWVGRRDGIDALKLIKLLPLPIFETLFLGCTTCSLFNTLHAISRLLVQCISWSSKVKLPSIVWRTKCHTIDCAHNTFLLLQKHMTSGTELILTGWKIVPNEEHVQCDHRFASLPLANEPLHSSQLFDTSLQKARGTTSLCGPWAALHFRD